MTNRDPNKSIDSAHKVLVDVKSSKGIDTGGNDHPNNWTEQQLEKYAEEKVLEFAQLTEWRDNPKAGPPFRGYEGCTFIR